MQGSLHGDCIGDEAGCGAVGVPPALCVGPAGRGVWWVGSPVCEPAARRWKAPPGVVGALYGGRGKKDMVACAGSLNDSHIFFVCSIYQI